MAKGVKSIIGNVSPEVGEKNSYQVSSLYPGTVLKNENEIKWKLYAQRSSGKWRELRGPIKTGKKAPFTFPEKWLGKKLLIEAYAYDPELKSPPGLIVTPKAAKVPRITNVELLYVDDTPGIVFSFMEKLRAKAHCNNLFGKKLLFTLWEDDATGVKHDARNKIIEQKEAQVDKDGVAVTEFTLTRALMKKALQGEIDVRQVEFYVTVEYYSQKKHASNNVNIDTPKQDLSPSKPKSAPPLEQPKAKGSAAEQKGASKKEEKGIIESVKEKVSGIVTQVGKELIDFVEQKGTVKKDKEPTVQKPEGKSVTTVEAQPGIENLLDAYFAKKEYTKQTGEEAGIFEYTFAGDGNKTGNDAQKENIAKTILGKPNVVALKDKKQYATIEAIKMALRESVYNKNQKITFKTFRLGEEFKRVNSAPLEDKLYLVAATSMLDGKEATIIIKEKEGLIKGSAGALLPVLEITEEQMEQKSSAGELQGTEKTEFKGTVKDGMVKIPIQLRPKSDDELKQWRDKLAKGKEEGTYTYTFASQTALPNGSGEKKRIAGIILNNAKNGLKNNPEIEEGKTAFVEDIENALTKERYLEGETITFKLFKKQDELLYLRVKVQGEKLHDQEFLKQEGAYFQIGKKCICEEKIRAFMRMIRVAEGTGEYYKGTKEARNPQLGYTTWFTGTGKNFSDLSTHPQTINCNKSGLCSSAAGAYQIMGWKFDELNGYLIQEHNGTYKTVKPLVYDEDSDLAKKYNAKGFSEISQDRLCLIILTKKNIIPSILNDNIEEAIDKAKGIWVSLPGATAGQPTAKMKETLQYYQEFLTKELSGNTNLHVKTGFLKDFGYTCQCQGNQTANSSWHDPIDNPEIALYNYYGVYNPAGSSFGKVRNRGTKNHQGLDIFAPSGTPVKACLDGTVVTVSQNDGNWGKLIVIEVDKGDLDNSRHSYILQYLGEIEKGSNYSISDKRFLRYAHLSKTNVVEGDSVKAGDTIGLSGNTGNALNQNIRARHLHFDIANVKDAGLGTGERENPAFYVRLVSADNNKQKNNTK